MHLIEIPDINYKEYFPEDLSECDERQYIETSALIYRYQTGQIDYEEFRIHALYKILNMKVVKPKNSILDDAETMKQEVEKHSKIWQLSQMVDSFFTTNSEGKLEIKQYYINNPIPKFRGGLFNYYGPSDEFNNIKFGEYIDALEAFVDFDQTKDTIYLYKLLAIMYRKRNLLPNKFDPRQKYNPHTVDKRTHLFRHQHIGIVYGFYLYFASLHKYKSTAKLFVQGNEIDLALLYDNAKTEKSKIPGIGMKGILYTMAESGIFGDLDKTRDALMWEIEVRMYDIVKRNADQEEAFKNTKP